MENKREADEDVLKRNHMSFYAQPEERTNWHDKPAMFLRVGKKGGLYFFSPKKTTIYYMSADHVKELMSGEREFACIHKSKTLRNVDQ